MKILIHVVLVGLALALPGTDYQAFLAGDEYIYKYDSQIVTGLHKLTSINSGFRLSAQLRLQFITQIRVRARLEKIVLYKLNQPCLLERADENLIPEEGLKELQGAEAKRMTEFLAIPFGFEYEYGHIFNVILDDHETEWSANAKRGLMSLFEVNTNKRMLLQDSPRMTSPKLTPSIDTYKVLETSAAGECATFYTLRTSSGNDYISITKTRDYSECLCFPQHITSVLGGYFPEHNYKDNPVSFSAIVRYSLRGSKQKFIIVSAVAENKILFSLHKDTEEVQTSANQTLYLTNSNTVASSNKIEEIKADKHKRNSLQMTLPPKSVDPQDPFSLLVEELQQLNQPADTYQVETLLTHLKLAAEYTRESTSKESHDYLRVLMDMIRSSPESILKELWEKLAVSSDKFQTEEETLMLKILWNVLPDAGTEASTKLVLDICKEEPLMADNCSLALNKITLRATPTAEIVSKLISLIHDTKNSGSDQMKQTAYLSLGSLGFSLIQAKHRHKKLLDKADKILSSVKTDSQKQVRDEIAEKRREIRNKQQAITSTYHQVGYRIVQTIQELFEEGNTEDTVLGLKSLANSGLPQAVPILKKILLNSAEPQFLRILSVFGFQRMYYDIPAKEEADKTLLSIYLNPRETNEFRNMAFIVLINLSPERPVLESIAQSLRYEKDAHVSNLVKSYLEAHANSSFSILWSMMKNATSALKFAPKESKGIDHSFTKRISKLYDGYKLGTAVQLTGIGSMHRYEGYALNFDAYIFGLYSNVFEIGFNSESLLPFLDKIFGSKGLMTMKKSIFDFLKRVPRDTSPEEKIHELFKLLNVKPRMTDFPAAHIYYKVGGNELGYIDFTEYLRSITMKGKIALDLDEDGLKVGLPIDVDTLFNLLSTKWTLPTESGLPCSLKLHSSAAIKINGTVGFQASPYLYEDDRHGRRPEAVKVSVDLKPKATIEMYGSMGLDWHYIQSMMAFRGVLKIDMPIKQELTKYLGEGRFKLVNFVPKLENPVLEMFVEPVSEVRYLTNNKKTPVMSVESQPVYAPSGSKVRPIGGFVEIPHIGQKIGVTGQLPLKVSKHTPFHPLSGRTVLNLWVKPLGNAPEVITLQGTYIYIPTAESRSPEKKPDSSSPVDNPYQTPEEIPPKQTYRDDIDLSKESIDAASVARKLEQIRGKVPFPADGNVKFAAVVTLDANSEKFVRRTLLELLCKFNNRGNVSTYVSRLWRSSLPDYDALEWQILGWLKVKYPSRVFEAQDIFSAEFQQLVLKNLEHMVDKRDHKVQNEILNVTILTELEKLNRPAMTKFPAYRVLVNLIPQQLYKSLDRNVTSMFNHSWKPIWKKLGILKKQVQHLFLAHCQFCVSLSETEVLQMLQVEDEWKHLVRPEIMSRDDICLDYLHRLLGVQKKLIRALDEILKKKSMYHADLPFLEWTVLIQSQTVYMLEDTVSRDIMNGAISQEEKLLAMVTMSQNHLSTVVEKMVQVLATVNFITKDKNAAGKPMVISMPGSMDSNTKQTSVYMPASSEQDIYKPLGEYQEYKIFSPEFGSVPSSYDVPGDVEQETPLENEYLKVKERSSDGRIDPLRHILRELSLSQAEMIEDIQLAVFHKKKVNIHSLTDLAELTQTTLSHLDKIWKAKAIYDDIVIEKVLLITSQNEFIVFLLKMYKERTANIQTTDSVIEDIKSSSFMFKTQSYYLGQRVASLYRDKLLQDVVKPNISEEDQPLHSKIQSIQRQQDVELRDFEIHLARNITALKNQIQAAAEFEKFIGKVDTFLMKLEVLVKEIAMAGSPPKVYIVIDTVEVINNLKHMIEIGRETILPLEYQQRLSWLETLDKQATQVQTLMSHLSEVFDKFVNSVDRSEDEGVLLRDRLALDSVISDLQKIMTEQSALLQEFRQFFQDSSPPSTVVVQEFLAAVLNSSVHLQSELNSLAPKTEAVLELKLHSPSRLTQSSVMMQAFNQQRKLYELLHRALNDRMDILENQPSWSETLRLQELDLSYLESNLNKQLMYQQEELDYPNADDPGQRETSCDSSSQQDDSSSQCSSKEHIPLQPSNTLNDAEENFSGVEAMWNISWGHGLDKSFKLQMTAKRSVEQLVWLYKQTDAVLRSLEIQHALRHKLISQPWEEDSAKEILNSFDHIHLRSEFKQGDLPQWLIDYGLRLQDYLKMTFWDEYSRESPASFMNKDRMQVIFDLSEASQKLDLFLMTGQETNRYLNIPLPSQFKAFKFNQNYRSTERHFLSYISSDFIPAECDISGDMVRTFDKMVYQLPALHGICEQTLLAMDCSPEKTFAISMTRDKTQPSGLGLRIMYDAQVIDINNLFKMTSIKVNNKTTEFIPYTHKDVLGQGNQPSLHILPDGLCTHIEVPTIGVYITVDASFVKLQVPELYKKKVCGLCGNFDTQQSWEFEGPSQETHLTANSFVSSYTIPDEACSVEPRPLDDNDLLSDPGSHSKPAGSTSGHRLKGREPHFDLRDSVSTSAESKEEKDQFKPVAMTVVKYRNKKSMTCFSLKPVLHCPEGVKAVKTMKEKIEYMCLPSTDLQVEVLKTKAFGQPYQPLGPISNGSKVQRYTRHHVKCQP